MSEARVQPPHPEHDAGWTDQRVETLKRMWNEGRSAGEIRTELGGGVTRSAVIGKVHRLKLEKRAQAKPRPPKPHGNLNQPKVNAIIARASMPAKPLPTAEAQISGSVGLLDLTNHTCRWPVGAETGARQMFCGCHADMLATGPYCSKHTAKAEVRR